MKTGRVIVFSLVSLFFTGCFSLPGYINGDGTITPSYSKEIIIEALEGSISIFPIETSKGITNINPSKSDTLKTQKQNMIFLNTNDNYNYYLEGNHSVVLAFRTMSKDAIFRITYKGNMSEYSIHNSDISDKLIYIENY